MHRVSGTPPVPGELAEVREVSAWLRAAKARLRELLAERDVRISQMEAQIPDLAARVKQNRRTPRSRHCVRAVGLVQRSDRGVDVRLTGGFCDAIGRVLVEN